MTCVMSNLTRREWFRSAAIAVAPLVVPSRLFGAFAPSNRITVGCIGLGAQGLNNLKNFLYQPAAQVVAVCDCDRRHLEAGRREANLPPDAAYVDFRDLLARSDIDAVVISTPDHWHAPMTLAAIAAGKDVFCEKPLTHTIAEGRRLVEAVRRSGRVVQVGTQQRADRLFQRAVELVWARRFGRLQRVEVEISGVNLPNPTDWKPEPVPDYFNYDLWLGPAPFAPYTPLRCHYNFRFISDYSGGQLTNWGSHHLDIVQWALDADNSGPVEIRGAGHIPQDGLFDVADPLWVEYRYADDVKVICQTGEPARRGYNGLITFYCQDGWIAVTRGQLTASDEKRLRAPLDFADKKAAQTEDLVSDFLNAVRTRQKPACDVETAHRSAAVCHLGNIAIQCGRPLRWDAKKEEFMGDDVANRLRDKLPRHPYVFG